MSKDKLPTVNIKGSQYTLVKDRVLHFNETYPNGAIVTELLSNPDAERVVVKATVCPDVDKPARHFVDHSQAVIGDGMVNKTAALENASTSAVGRALAMMGIGVIESVASADEIHKAGASASNHGASPNRVPSDKQLYLIRSLCKQLGLAEDEVEGRIANLKTSADASMAIATLQERIAAQESA